MKNIDLWKETFVKFKKNDYVIDEDFIDYHSLLISKQTLLFYKKLIKDSSRKNS